MHKKIEQTAHLFDSWDNAVILITNSGVIASWNKGARDLYGYSAAEIIGQEYSFLLPFDVKDETLMMFKKIQSGEPGARCDTVHRRKDDSRVHVELTLSPVRDEMEAVVALVIFVRNTAEREQAMALFDAFTQSSPIGIYIVQDGNFQFINRQFERIIGYSMDELLKTRSSDYIHPDDRELVRSNAVNALKSGRCDPYEYRIVTKSGQTKWILETVITYPTRGKRATLGNFMDITESKRMQEETQRANKTLTSMVKKLEEQRKQSAILTEMRDMLQACSTMGETAPIIMGYIKKLFPNSQGALFLLSNSRSDLESIITWGGFPKDAENHVFTPDACWGLRRGRAHVVEDIEIGPICPHLKHVPTSSYVCLPLMAKGDILGLLHLVVNANINHSDTESDMTDLKEMATVLTEYLSISLANVKLSENLAMQSIQDPQTGLYNRRFMEESLQREILRAARKQTQIGLIMADLDHFKKFNDVYGHAAGDKIISLVGKLMRDSFRGSDIACRYGGEEFLVILPESSLEDTINRADFLREEVKKIELVFQGQVLGAISASMGVASYPIHGTKIDELLRMADVALYKAKQAGRDRVVTLNLEVPFHQIIGYDPGREQN
jgi:diguanylate cyclase (GGDEF)-like protein/PAS domain S-box-containing protein